MSHLSSQHSVPYRHGGGKGAADTAIRYRCIGFAGLHGERDTHPVHVIEVQSRRIRRHVTVDRAIACGIFAVQNLQICDVAHHLLIDSIGAAIHGALAVGAGGDGVVDVAHEVDGGVRRVGTGETCTVVP